MSLSRKNRIKDKRSPFTLCEELQCLREPEHQHSKHFVLIYSKKTNQRMKFIECIPDTMAKVVQGLISECKFNQLIVKFDGKHRGAPEET